MTKDQFSTCRKLTPMIKILQKQPRILQCGSHISMMKCDPPPGHLSMGVTVCRYTDRNFKAVYKVGLCDEFYSVFNYDNKN